MLSPVFTLSNKATTAMTKEHVIIDLSGFVKIKKTASKKQTNNQQTNKQTNKSKQTHTPKNKKIKRTGTEI